MHFRTCHAEVKKKRGKGLLYKQTAGVSATLKKRMAGFGSCDVISQGNHRTVLYSIILVWQGDQFTFDGLRSFLGCEYGVDMKACIWHKGDDLYYMPNSYRRRSSGFISSRRRREGQIYMMYYEIVKLERELMGAYPILLSQLRSCFDDKFMICRSPIFSEIYLTKARRSLDLPTFGSCTPFCCLQNTGAVIASVALLNG